MRLTLHIGLGKTGTSSLQAFLEHEGTFLKKHSLAYTGINLLRLGEAFHLKNQGQVNNDADLEQAIRTIEQAAGKMTGVDELIWSNESLSMGFSRGEIAPKIHALLKDSKIISDVKVIMVVRRQDDWIESAYRQWALRHKLNRSARILSPMEFKTTVEKTMDYEALFQSWSVFGEEAVTLVPYDEARAGRGIVDYFCKTYGMSYEDRFDDYDEVNPSLGVSQSYFIGVYASGFSRPVMPQEFEGLIKRYKLPELAPKNAAFYSNAQREGILEEYQARNTRLAQRLFGREELFPDTKTRNVIAYETGSEDAATYFAIICKQQQALINRQNKRLADIEFILDTILDDGLSQDKTVRQQLRERLK
ncbi:MAG: hypothetical protein ACRBCL_06605 [Maritimibacter sp.]